MIDSAKEALGTIAGFIEIKVGLHFFEGKLRIDLK